MIKNFKFRTNASIVIHNNRKPRRHWWTISALAVVGGGIYATLQMEGDVDSVNSVRQHQTLSLPLALPGTESTSTETAPVPPRSLSAPELAGIPVALPTTMEQPADEVLTPNPAPVESQSSADTLDEDLGEVASVETEVADAEIAAPVEIAAPEEPQNHPVVLTHKIKPGDSLARIFDQFELPAALLHKIVNCGESANQLNRIRPGQVLNIELDADRQFSQLTYKIDPVKTLRVTREDEELTATLEKKDIEKRPAEVSGTIESSLFLSAQRAGLSDKLTMKLAEIFGWDIDFALEIRAGDRFSVVYEEQWLENSKFKDGNILAAEFVNKGKVYRAVRYKGPDGKEEYYTPEGQPMRKTFLRTPVKFSRISSGFTKRRWHPVLKKWRSHKGVDYAAPRGTPVKSAGDGQVTFVGRQGGYGKVIFVQHEGIYTTVYGHLNGFAKGIRKGKRIRQGELLGYVGSTGLASGPHLHYEFRVNGKHRNPLKVTFAPAAPLKDKYLPAFQKETKPLLAKLDNLNNTLVADAL